MNRFKCPKCEKNQYSANPSESTGCIYCGNENIQRMQTLDESAECFHSHYGGGDNPYEAIKVIENWNLGFCLGNAVKYIARVGKKDPDKTIEDLKKAVWYINREIERMTENEV